LKNKLIDRGNIMKVITVALIKAGFSPAIQVSSGAFAILPGKSLVSQSEAGSSEGPPVITLDLDIKGVDYKKLVLMPSAQKSFAQAVQEGIASQVSSLEAKTIALDVSRAPNSPGGTPITHVVAKIPLPAGIEPDATMSNWPGGRAGVLDAVTKGLEDMPGIDLVTRDATGAYGIQVISGSFNLGGIRASYATQVVAEIRVGWTGATATDEAATENVLKDALVLKGQVAEDSVVLKRDAASVPTAQIFKATVTLDSTSDTADKLVSEWTAKFSQASVEARSKCKRFPSAAGQVVQVGLNIADVERGVETIDLDFTIHGINYSDLNSKKTTVFLRDLADGVRDGLDYTHTVGGAQVHYADVHSVKDNIHVTFLSEAAKGAVKVRAAIPAPTGAANTLGLLKRLQKNLDGALKDNLEKTLRNLKGMDFVSTWTTANIRVTMPGHDL